MIQQLRVTNIRRVDSGLVQGLCDVTLKGSDLGPLSPLTFHECRFLSHDPEQPPWPTLPQRSWTDEHLRRSRTDEHLRDGYASLATVPLPVFQEIQRFMLRAWGEEFGEPDTLEKFESNLLSWKQQVKDGNHPNVHWFLLGDVYEFSVAAFRIVEQRKVLDAVREGFFQGTPSTLIAVFADVSPWAVQRHLRTLEAKGELDCIDGGWSAVGGRP